MITLSLDILDLTAQFLERSWSIVGWGEIKVADLGVWSAVGRGEFRVADPGFLCLEPPSPVGP